MRLSKEELTDAAYILFDALCTGMTDREAMDDLGVDPDTYLKVKNRMFEMNAEELRSRPSEHVYIEYMINQTANIRDLTAMIGSFKATKQYNAMVGAVRARADLYDKLIARGQEFGIIKKMPDRKEVFAGVVLADLSNEELRGKILGEISDLNKRMKEFDDKDVLDVAAGDTHYGPALPAATTTKSKAPASSEPIAKPGRMMKARTGGKNTSRSRGRKKR